MKTQEIKADIDRGAKVAYAKLHSPIFVPGVAGNLKDTLTDKSTSTERAVNMHFTGTLLIAEIGDTTILIPSTSVSHMVLAK